MHAGGALRAMLTVDALPKEREVLRVSEELLDAHLRHSVRRCVARICVLLHAEEERQYRLPFCGRRLLPGGGHVLELKHLMAAAHSRNHDVVLDVQPES